MENTQMLRSLLNWFRTSSCGNGSSFEVRILGRAVVALAVLLCSAVHLEAATAPKITTQPASKTVTAGASVSFTVVATGSPTPTYQWRKGSVGIAGATSATYTIAATAATDAGAYSVVIANAAGSVTSSSATLVINSPPVITTQPTGKTAAVGSNTSFTVVATGTATLTYQWKKDGANISGASAATYTISSVAMASAGTYSVVVKNSVGSVTSNGAALSVNIPPLVTITEPPAYSIIALGGSVPLAATATDEDGTVTKVEFFTGLTKIGEDSTAPYSCEWTPLSLGPVVLTARATDNLGAVSTSQAVGVQISPTLPYTADFESAEGYALGTLDNQSNWSIAAGTAEVSNETAHHGVQSVVLNPGAVAARIDQEFALGTTNLPTVYVDFYAKPVAGSDVTEGTLFDLDVARIAFVQSGETGYFAVLDGDGSGEGTWQTLSGTVALASDRVTAEWQRLTIAVHYQRKTWDLFIDGQPVAADLRFRNDSANYLSIFSLKGHTDAGVRLDDLYVGASNPLFTDENDDGIDDAWESAHGLSLQINQRDLDSDNDGLTNIREYVLGSDPTKADSDDDGLSDGVEYALGSSLLIPGNYGPVLPVAGAILHLRADLGAVTDGAGQVSRWGDLSGRSNDATQSLPENQPTLVFDPVLNQSVMHFDRTRCTSLLLPNFLSGAQAGEIIAVVRKSDVPEIVGLWAFGASAGSRYPEYDGCPRDDFGTDQWYIPGPAPAAAFLQSFHTYGVAADGHSWSQYFNGKEWFHRSVNNVAFRPDPMVGDGQWCSFDGDIAELIVYNRVLSLAERDAVNSYLLQKYSSSEVPVPDVPTLSVSQSSGSSVAISWAPQTNGAVHSVTMIERQVENGEFLQIGEVSDGVSFADASLSAGTRYTYRARARSYGGVSDYGAPSSIVIDPVKFPGLRIWLKADAGATPDSIGNIREWTDQSGAGNSALQFSSSEAPTLVSHAIGDKPAIHFDGAGDSMYFNKNPMVDAQGGEIFVVARLQDFTNADNYLLQFGKVPGGTIYRADGILDNFGTIVQTHCIGPSPTVLTQAHIFNSQAWVPEGYCKSIIRVNGLEVGHRGALSGRREVAAVYFCPSPAIGYKFKGDIAEIIAYDHALSAADREAVGAYLASKYAIAAIPVPDKPTLRAFVRSTTSVDLEWSTPPGLHTTTTIERQVGAGAFAVVAEVQDCSNFLDRGLVVGRIYTYRIKVRSLSGISPYSDAVVVNLSAQPQTVAAVQGGSGVAITGSWLADGTGIYARCLRGSVNYDMAVPSDGLYALDIAIRDLFGDNPVREFLIDVSIDGSYIGILSIKASGNTPGTGRMYLPALASGVHNVTLIWHNGQAGSFLKILSLSLTNPSLEDADGDGEADWVTERLARTFQFDPTFVQTPLSPYQVEGASAFPAFVKSSVTYADETPAIPAQLAVKNGLAGRFYVDVPLHQGSSATVLVAEAGGIRETRKMIEWKPLNLVGLDNQQMLVRSDSSLLVQAVDLGASPPTSFEVTVLSPSGQGQQTTLTPDQVYEISLEEVGIYIVSVARPGQAAVVAATLTVRSGKLNPAPMAVVEGFRVWTPLQCPAEAVLETDPSISALDCVPCTVPRSFELVTPAADGRAVLRLGPAGPILDSAVISPIRNYSVDKSTMDIVDTLPDGTQIWQNWIDLDGFLSDSLKIQISIYKAGVTFDDGTTTRTITRADLDANGRYTYFLLRPAGTDGSVCHHVDLYEATVGDLGLSY